MGNVDSRAGFTEGHIMLQTDMPFYEPNMLVTGRIYLRLTRPIDADRLDLEIVGKEKVAWTDFEHHSVSDGNGGTRSERYAVPRKGKEEIFQFK